MEQGMKSRFLQWVKEYTKMCNTSTSGPEEIDSVRSFLPLPASWVFTEHPLFLYGSGLCGIRTVPVTENPETF